jgi:hypothetical protein
MSLPLPERLTDAADRLSIVIGSTPPRAEVRLSRLDALCHVRMHYEASAAISMLRTERDSPAEACKQARASIVRFLEAEAVKFSQAADYAGDEDPECRDRLDCKASILRTMAAYVSRGDDLNVPPV